MGGEGLKVKKLLNPLNVCQLVRSQQATAKLYVWVCWERIGLHKVGDEADCRLWEGFQAVVEPALFVGDVA
jgi:hypothetical protein